MARQENPICPLCENQSTPFYQKEFFRCSHCEGIFKPKHLLPNSVDEKEHYEKHINDVDCPKYQNFVSPITHEIQKDFSIHSLGVDFGAGTGPVIQKVLQDKGYSVEAYDPYFHPNQALLENRYDFIAASEVIEHFFNPKKEFALLKNLLKPNGKLYCMTHIYDESIDFANWYYKNDPTHVFLYQKKTLEFIAQKFDFQNLKIEKRLIVFSNQA